MATATAWSKKSAPAIPFIKTSGIKNANTDDEVYVKFTGERTSKYFLDRAGDDREKNKINTYDIFDPNIGTIRDIKFMHIMIDGNDGWCVKSVELLVNDGDDIAKKRPLYNHDPYKQIDISINNFFVCLICFNFFKKILNGILRYSFLSFDCCWYRHSCL